MNRLLRHIFCILAVLLAAYAVLLANFLHVTGWHSQGKIVIGAAAIAIFLALAGHFFPLKIKFKIFMVLLGLFAVELILQIAALAGILPGLEVRVHAPFARVYWTPEGFSQGIRNRFGWYASAFDLNAPHKIALLGDSQIEGLEVPHTKNQSADLQKLLDEKSGGWSVMSLGWRGISPAFDLDFLDYAWRHFQPQEAIVVVSIGSAVSESSRAFSRHSAHEYIFYDLDAQGQLVMNPGSAKTREQFDEELELPHRSVLFNLPTILDSYCMILQTFDSMHDNLARRVVRKRFRAHMDDDDGFNPGPFAANPTPEADGAMKVMLAELAACKKICEAHGMKFRLATIPAFRPRFFKTQHGGDWSVVIDGMDYFKPDREVVAWARANGVPVASMGEYLQQKKMDVNEIHGLFFKDGTGHLTVKGHAVCAQAIYDAFYKNPSS